MREGTQTSRATKIMDDRYGPGWRNLPLLRSPEWARAWEEAGPDEGPDDPPAAGED
ncbi:hypothetical protein D869_gp249 [Caulobacter phage CcrRogue]|uniref:Uncharacterized protein n=1 Tax=Caulobacter phage CcrRogue TaxID=2927986 RepID=K4JQU8_9CAUD|nr:hypothetical protein D869_gp249 [Caulobacter phage CcrRogue]AFU86665.1 hypothetical protein CcrRogue_gp183 [Caulobacter phage CcrRogue]